MEETSHTSLTGWMSQWHSSSAEFNVCYSWGQLRKVPILTKTQWWDIYIYIYIYIYIRVFCPRAGPSLQAQEPRLQFCRRQVFHHKLRNQGCSFTRDVIGAVASRFFLHATLSLASEQTLKDPRGTNLEERRVDLAEIFIFILFHLYVLATLTHRPDNALICLR